METNAPPSQINYVSEAFLIFAIVMIVAPLMGVLSWTLISLLPVIVFRQPDEIMLAWGWVGFPLAFLGTPVIMAMTCWFLLRRMKSPYALSLVPGVVVLYPLLAFATPLGTYFIEACKWLGLALT